MSGMSGRPVEAENRTVREVEGRVGCGARVSFAGSGHGTKVPEHIRPWAGAGVKPGCTPVASKASSTCLARAGFVRVPAGAGFPSLSLGCVAFAISRNQAILVLSAENVTSQLPRTGRIPALPRSAAVAGIRVKPT